MRLTMCKTAMKAMRLHSVYTGDVLHH